MTASPPDSSGSSTASPPSSFIRTLIARDLETGVHAGRVHTRFPPEPNGHLHIGHAKSICLNFGVAEESGGHCNLRFDDTNPLKESQEYVDAIKDSIAWLGFQWHGKVRYSSDYFPRLYEFAQQLIRSGRAYVCSLSAEQAREHRGTLTEPGKDSPDRNRPVQENLRLFAAMKAGEYQDGACTLRAKIDMASPNINLRDPVLYRIRHAHHHQTGARWCIYPTYDYSHCISDALENITHSLCTLDFEDHRPLYDWILHSLDPESLRAASDRADDDADYVLPRQIEFAKLRLGYTIMGKRKLRELVESGIVSGWDDPRMPTIAGMRRRGVTPLAIRNFCESIGVSRSESVVDPAMLEHAIREDLDRHAPRVMCVLNPLKLVLDDLDEDHEEWLDLPNHPKDAAMGRRAVPLTREILIDRADFHERPPPGYKRLTPGGEVRLRGAYVVRCKEVRKDANGAVQELICSVDRHTLGRRPVGRKVKGVIHWVSGKHGAPVSVRLYDRLFTVENPESGAVEDYHACLNSDSLVELHACVVEPAALEEGAPTAFQFEREGYFCLDAADSTRARPVFNRTITLRDSRSS